jgi:hypothetical protein
MVPRPLLTLLAFCAFFALADAAPTTGRAGTTDRPQAPAVVQKTITVEVMTPDGAWELKIEEIRQVQGELWVFAKVDRPAGAIGAMMVSAASDQVSGRFPDLKIKTFVVGKTWTWANEEPVTFITATAATERRRQGQRLWRR